MLTDTSTLEEELNRPETFWETFGPESITLILYREMILHLALALPLRCAVYHRCEAVPLAVATELSPRRVLRQRRCAIFSATRVIGWPEEL